MPALMERPKMSLAMWAALKVHIMREREKKKQEQEADEAVQRLRREQEMKRKQDAMTIEEIRDQITQLENKLKDLRKQKHELFLYLKQVLHEDEKRRNEEDKEPNDMMQVGHSYPNAGLPVGAQNMYMIAGNTFMNRNQVLYKVGTAPQQNGAIKGPRNQSPPPNAGYQPGYNYKGHMTNFGPKPTPYTNAMNSGYYPHSTTAAGGTSTLVVTNSAQYAAFQPVQHPGGPYASQEQAKHLPAGYHVTHLQQPGMRYVANLHQPIDRGNQKPNMQDEKYYIHQTGGISSGYPVRSQPHQTSSRFQPPTSLNASTPIQVPARKDDVLRRNMQNESQR